MERKGGGVTDAKAAEGYDGSEEYTPADPNDPKLAQ